MGWLIVLILVVAIIGQIIINWKITLPFVILCIAYYFIIKQEEKKKEILLKKKEEQERIRQEILTKEIQKKEREQRVGGLITNSQLLSQKLSERVNSTQNALDTAEQEYRDGAFAPFWDAIEQAVTNLAHFNTGVRQITQNCSEYQTESRQLESSPVFDWKGATNIPDAITTSNRLERIVRAAQKNFQFAVIYEQRKTNQILVAGFAGLGQALSEIAYRIDESTTALSAAIADLSFTVSDTSAQAIEASREDTQATIKHYSGSLKSLQVIKEQAEAEAKARREHEKRELEMLDNIQHRRLPSKH